MPLLCLVRLTPLDPVTGQRVTVHVAQAQDRRITGLGGVVWEPALVRGPSTSIRLFNGDFVSAVQPGTASIPLQMGRLRKSIREVDRYNWTGAGVEIFVGKPGSGWPWATHFIGTVKSYARKEDVLTLTADVGDDQFRKDVLTATYAGTTGAEGGADIKNRLKPLVIGHAKSVEPVQIDATNYVFQFSGYGPIEEVTELFERASSFGSPVANYSSYANLVAASIPKGRYATCLAEGMIRLGAPPYGLITGDIKGHAVQGSTPRLTGEIIAAIAAIAGIEDGAIEAGTLDAMDQSVPYPINLVQKDQASFQDLARKLCLPCLHQAGISLEGRFFAVEMAFDSTIALTLESTGRSDPQVLSSEELAVSAPFAKSILGANRCWRPHSAQEIAFTSEVIDLGAFNASTVYREGNIVSLPNGARYIYINTTPSSGNEPPNVTYWTQISGPVGDATNIIYIKASSQPSTPSPSSGVPGSWVDDYASLSGTDLPVWASFGTKVSGATNYTWSTPYPMLADLRVYAGLDTDGNVEVDKVDSPAILSNAATAAAGYSNTTATSHAAVGSWGFIVQASTTAAVYVTLPPGTGQSVQIIVVLQMTDDGGSDPTVQMRCRRGDGTILGQTFLFEVPTEERTYTCLFLDSSPGASVTHEYAPQFNNDDGPVIFSRVVISAIALKR